MFTISSFRRRKSAVIFALSLMSCVVLSAEEYLHHTGNVFPVPRRAVFGEKIRVAAGKANISFASKEIACAPLVEKILRERLRELTNTTGGEREGRSLNLFFFLKDSDAAAEKPGGTPAFSVEAFSSPALEHENGYAIRCRESGEDGLDLVAVGSDNAGLFNAAATVLQLLGGEPGKAELQACSVDDWPQWLRPYTGVYYPFVVTEKNLIKNALFKCRGLAVQHRSDWRLFAPASGGTGELDKFFRAYQRFFALAEKFNREYGVTDFFALVHLYINDGKSLPFDISDSAQVSDLTERVARTAQSGVDNIMLCFDDWTPIENQEYVCLHPGEKERFGSIGNAQGWLVSELDRRLAKRFPRLVLSVVPAVYSLKAHEAGSGFARKYLADLCEALPERTPIAWTGPSVVSAEITQDEFRRFDAVINGHPSLVWDNSDCIGRPLAVWNTRFYPGFENDSYNSSIFLNNQAFYRYWPTIYAYTAVAALWNPQGYVPDDAHREACLKLTGLDYSSVASFREERSKLQRAEDRETKLACISRAETALVKMNAAGHEIRRLKSDLDKEKILLQANLPRYPLRFSAEPPVLDGKDDDACWQAAETARLTGRHGEEIAATETADFRIAFTRDAVFLLANLRHGKELDSRDFGAHDDMGIFYAADMFEIFLKVDPDKPFIHLAFDHEGHTYEQLGSENPGNWNTDWQVVIAKSPGRWTAEVMIPLSADLGLSGKPSQGTTWRANFCREYHAASSLQCWSPTYDNRFMEERLFGALEFVE